MFIINKIRDFIWPKTRKEIIYDRLDPFLQEIVFKYDYFLSDIDIFFKKENMTAITTLPNGEKIIAYSTGKVKVKDQEYPAPKYIDNIIALSNEEIVISNMFGVFQKWNFITSTKICDFRYIGSPIKRLFLLPNRKIVGYCIEGIIMIWDYDGKFLLQFPDDDIVIINVIDNTIFARTYTGKIKILNTDGSSKIIYEDSYTIDNQLYKRYISTNGINLHIYKLPSGKLLCDI